LSGGAINRKELFHRQLRFLYRASRLKVDVKDLTSHPFDTVTLVVAICWLSFIAYWVISAVGVKRHVAGRGSWHEWVLSRLALFVTIVALYKLQVLSGLRDFANSLSFFDSEAVRITGAILTAMGIAFAIWARVHLGRNWSPRPAMKVGHELVTSGPYRFVRHPIYTGLLTALLGSGLVNGPLWTVVFLIAALNFLWRIRVEEAYMMELFPDQYPAYRARTKALIPIVW
jgi:protein-S-isoprenylcysteine O-methyltransferase Ste14